MKVAFIYHPTKFSATLTEFWTGSRCYHVAIVDEEMGLMYDQHLIFRRRLWPHYLPENVKLVDTPVSISREYIENKLSTDENTYGWKDYLLFSLRPLFHLLGKSTPNVGGVICSELVFNILRENGWDQTFPEVPSPADLEKVLE